MILVGDVGGTKTRLALYESKKEKMIRLEKEDFPSADYQGLEGIINDFLKKRKIEVDAACFGVPGPVSNGESSATNLPWLLSERSIMQQTPIKKAKIINDLAALTSAVPHLTSDELAVLYPGTAPNKNAPRAVLAPGTGFGEAFLYFDGERYHVHASEGGHVDFAPNTELEIELLKYLQKKFGHVSYERVLCGPGLVNIYEFLKHSGFAPEPPELQARFESEDDAAVISTSGQAGEFPICVKALDMFVSMLGAQAGNMVLNLLAIGGAYLGGGIPPKISKKLSDGSILHSYLDKGRLRPVVEKAPLYLIKDDHAALLGAAYVAVTL
jgi:glucokinase